MPTIRPVAPEARLSIIEHLDELRTRLIWAIVVYILAFGVAYSLNNRVLDWLNKPLANANRVDCEKPRESADALEQTGCFGEALAEAFKLAAPALTDAGGSLSALADQRDLPADLRDRVDRTAKTLDEAAAGLVRAAEAAPAAGASRRGQPVTLGVTEPFLVTITVSAYAALLLSMPFLLYQLFAFVLPAFTRTERRLAVPVMFVGPVLFLAGVAFGYFLALPRAIAFLQNYNDGQYDILVQARDYYRFIVLLLTGMGLMFQIPLLVLAVVRLQILSPAQLRRTRGYALLLFAVVAALVTPTPDPITMLLAMSPLVILYEASIQLSRLIAPEGPSRWSMRFGDGEPDGDEQQDGDADSPAVEPVRHRPAPDDDGLD